MDKELHTRATFIANNCQLLIKLLNVIILQKIILL
jgi:hypothetical protein